jgi:hypothetical protein
MRLQRHGVHRVHGRRVRTHQPDPSRRQPRRQCRRQVGECSRERRLIHFTARPEQHSFRRTQVDVGDVSFGHHVASRHVHYHAAPEIRFQRHLRRRFAAIRYVQKTVGMRAGVDRGAERRHIDGITSAALHRPRHGNLPVARPYGGPAAERLSDVVNAHQTGDNSGRPCGRTRRPGTLRLLRPDDDVPDACRARTGTPPRRTAPETANGGSPWLPCRCAR